MGEQGDQGHHFYVIERGGVDVLRDGRSVSVLGPGDCFGEIAVLLGGRRTATVVARTQLRLWRITGAAYRHCLEPATAVDREVSRTAMRRVFGRLQEAVRGAE